MYVSMSVLVSAYVSMSVFVSVHVSVFASVHVFVSVSVHVSAYVSASLHISVSAYVSMYNTNTAPPSFVAAVRATTHGADCLPRAGKNAVNELVNMLHKSV